MSPTYASILNIRHTQASAASVWHPTNKQIQILETNQFGVNFIQNLFDTPDRPYPSWLTKTL